MTQLRTLLARDAVRRVVRTFLIAFLGLAVPGAFGWLNGLTEWARTEGQAPFPDASSLAYLGVSAITAGAIAAVNALVVGLEDVTGHALLRDVPNHRFEVPDDRGAVDVRTLVVVAVALGILLAIGLLLGVI